MFEARSLYGIFEHRRTPCILAIGRRRHFLQRFLKRRPPAWHIPRVVGSCRYTCETNGDRLHTRRSLRCPPAAQINRRSAEIRDRCRRRPGARFRARRAMSATRRWWRTGGPAIHYRCARASIKAAAASITNFASVRPNRPIGANSNTSGGATGVFSNFAKPWLMLARNPGC